ncbi:MAG: nuclear transport factor 2 family protein [Firmicutes bacterium]|nr:nuclear transport factor 2 family protein [Bacillota bacterium]
MLRKKFFMILLISLFSFVLTSCSVNRQNSSEGNDATPSNSEINENAGNIIITQALKSKDESVNIIIKIFQKLQKNDLSCLEGIADKDIVWEYEGVEGVVPFAGSFTGKEGIKKFWRTFLNCVTVKKAALRYSVHSGVILDLHWTEEGIVKSTGKKYIMESAQRWELNGKGKILKMRWYNNTFAMYHAFQPNTDPQLSLGQFPADYDVMGDNSVNALPIIQEFYSLFLTGNWQAILPKVADNNVFILAGAKGITPFAGTWLGPQGFIDFFFTLFTVEEYTFCEMHDYISEGCIVDVLFDEGFRSIKTGKVVNNRGLHSLMVNSQGQLVKFRSYNDTYSCAWCYSEDM